MFSWLTGTSSNDVAESGANVSSHSAAQPAAGASPSPSLHLLVIQEDNYDWCEILTACGAKPLNPRFPDILQLLPELAAGAGATAGGGVARVMRVVQTSWKDLHVGPATNQIDRRQKPGREGIAPKLDGTCFVTVSKRWVNGKPVEGRPICFSPDFVLVRNEVVTPCENHKNELLGLMFSNVPSINSLKTIYMCCDKPVVQAALHRARAALFTAEDAESRLPLIPMDFFPSAQGFFYGGAFPAVVKLGTAHAGYGKMRVHHHHDMDDVRGLLDLTTAKYATSEPFITGEKDLRVQKIGTHLRAFERVSVNGSWKTQTGTAILREIPVTDAFRDWIAAASVMFGASAENGDVMDILTVDAIVEETTGRTFILEVNGTSSGLAPDTEKEDNAHIGELVLDRMRQLYCR